MVAQGAAAALRTRPLPQPTASSLVVESILFWVEGEEEGGGKQWSLLAPFSAQPAIL